jgi:hypothetical protein
MADDCFCFEIERWWRAIPAWPLEIEQKKICDRGGPKKAPETNVEAIS